MREKERERESEAPPPSLLSSVSPWAVDLSPLLLMVSAPQPLMTSP